MTAISDKDRARALTLCNLYHLVIEAGGSDDSAWLAVRDHVLAAHECPTVPEPEPDPRIRVVVEWSKEPAVTDDEDAIELLARLDALTEGEQP